MLGYYRIERKTNEKEEIIYKIDLRKLKGAPYNEKKSKK